MQCACGAPHHAACDTLQHNGRMAAVQVVLPANCDKRLSSRACPNLQLLVAQILLQEGVAQSAVLQRGAGLQFATSPLRAAQAESLCDALLYMPCRSYRKTGPGRNWAR